MQIGIADAPQLVSTMFQEIWSIQHLGLRKLSVFLPRNLSGIQLPAQQSTRYIFDILSNFCLPLFLNTYFVLTIQPWFQSVRSWERLDSNTLKANSSGCSRRWAWEFCVSKRFERISTQRTSVQRVLQRTSIVSCVFSWVLHVMVNQLETRTLMSWVNRLHFRMNRGLLSDTLWVDTESPQRRWWLFWWLPWLEHKSLRCKTHLGTLKPWAWLRCLSPLCLWHLGGTSWEEGLWQIYMIDELEAKEILINDLPEI